MPNKHINEFLNYYIKLDNPQYAVLLKGKWGSGKTHYINEYKKHLDENNSKYIYVSLYGVTSYDEIETKFLETIHPRLYNKKTIFMGKIAKGFLKGTLKLDLDNDGISDGDANVQVPDFKPEDLLNTKDHILIFDDLERCSIDIVNLLGYINYFVEHQSYKVIVIANEEELNKTDKKYKLIKEKLIGKTFEFSASVESAYKSFLFKLENENTEMKNVHLKYKDILLTVFEMSNCNNLRILRQVMFDFQRFYLAVLYLHKENEELLNDFIKVFFILNIENKISGYDVVNNYYKNRDKYLSSISSKDFSNALGIKNKEIERTNKNLKLFQKFIEKYKLDINYFSMIISEYSWNRLIYDSYIDKEKIDSELKLSGYYKNQNEASWKRLSYYYNLNDNEFEEVLNDVFKKFEENKYTDFLQNKLVASMLLYFSENHLLNFDTNKLLDVCKEVFLTLFNENELTLKKIVFNAHGRFFYDRSYDGLGFFESTAFKELNDSLEELIKSKKDNILKMDSELIIDAIKEKNTNKLFSLLEHSNENEAISYRNEPILVFIDVDKLFKELKSTNGTLMHIFGGILKDRYYVGQENIFKEKEFLNEILVKVDKYLDDNKFKLSSYNLKKEIKFNIEEALSNIQNLEEKRTK